MDFELSDDQVALREAAHRLLSTQSPPERVRGAMASGCFDRELWAAMTDQGWLAMEQPEELGGLGLGLVETVVLCEEVGHFAAPVPYLPSVLAQQTLAAAAGRPGAAGEWAGVWAGKLAEGEAIGCVAWGPGRSPVRAERTAGGWAIHGTTAPVVGAPDASVALVVATAVDDPSTEEPVLLGVAVDEDRRAKAEPAMDLTRTLGRLTFDGTPAEEIGRLDAVEALVDRGATMASAQLLGGGTRVLDMAVAYAKERVQFGRPIGSFQAVKHRCADMLVDVEGMRSTTYYAAWCVGQGTPDRSVAASSAKAWCSEAGRRVMASGLQVHGGIGFTWEHDLHIYLKRAQLDQWSFGGSGYHLDRLAGALRRRVEAAEPVL